MSLQQQQLLFVRFDYNPSGEKAKMYPINEESIVTNSIYHYGIRGLVGTLAYTWSDTLLVPVP